MILRNVIYAFLTGIIGFTSQAICADTIPDFTIFALKKATGSVWNNVTNKSEYLVSYDVTVNKNTNDIIFSGKESKMCFYLENGEGKKLMSYGAQLKLLSPYTPKESRTGTLYFSSINPDLLNLPYVKLGLVYKKRAC